MVYWNTTKFIFLISGKLKIKKLKVLVILRMTSNNIKIISISMESWKEIHVFKLAWKVEVQWSWQDSNLQFSDLKSNALSIKPHGHTTLLFLNEVFGVSNLRFEIKTYFLIWMKLDFLHVNKSSVVRFYFFFVL